MKIGFFIEWMVGSLDKKNKWSVVGEELLAQGWCKELRKLNPEIAAEIYSYNKLPSETLDLMIYMNYITKPIDKLSRKRLMYIENDYLGDKGNLDVMYNRFKDYYFDGILCYSETGCRYFEDKGYKTHYLPFSVDTELYHPVPYDKNFDYDIAHVGTNNKGMKKTKDFLKPALNYKFGLFGNWKTKFPVSITLKNILFGEHPVDIYALASLIRYFILITKHRFNIILSEKSQGRISTEDMIKLLSSSKINLNMTLPGNLKLDITNYRIMEAFACKGFVISDYTPSIEKSFGDAVVFAKNTKDLKNKIKYYLAHPEERQIKAEKGYRIVQEKFTAKQRAKELYEIITEYI